MGISAFRLFAAAAQNKDGIVFSVRFVQKTGQFLFPDQKKSALYGSFFYRVSCPEQTQMPDLHARNGTVFPQKLYLFCSFLLPHFPSGKKHFHGNVQGLLLFFSDALHFEAIRALFITQRRLSDFFHLDYDTDYTIVIVEKNNKIIKCRTHHPVAFQGRYKDG